MHIYFLFQDLDSELSERVEAFGFDSSQSYDAEMGLGESRLHLEGKRDKDKQLDSDERRELKRKNREAVLPDEKKRKKLEDAKKRKEKLELFSCPQQVAKLCNHNSTCCSEHCLRVRPLSAFILTLTLSELSLLPKRSRIIIFAN